MPRILLVDDDHLLRSSLGDFLRDAGMGVDEASDGEKALRLIKCNKYDLLITDIIMPQCDGLELSRGALDHDPDIRIIAISGGGLTLEADFVLRWSQLNGAHAVLQKPFRSSALLTLVENLLLKTMAPALYIPASLSA